MKRVRNVCKYLFVSKSVTLRSIEHTNYRIVFKGVTIRINRLSRKRHTQERHEKIEGKAGEEAPEAPGDL